MAKIPPDIYIGHVRPSCPVLSFREAQRIALPNIINHNDAWNTYESKRVYLDDFDMKFRDEHILGLLRSLPEDEPITNRTVKSILLSYLGNGAKKKLAELSTAGAIRRWLVEQPESVIETVHGAGIWERFPKNRPKPAGASDTSKKKTRSERISEIVNEPITPQENSESPPIFNYVQTDPTTVTIATQTDSTGIAHNVVNATNSP